ncbi:MAG TPA: protein-disulfide reductase DsbD domain-containing protein [Gammaproteobacteria bacterium]|nr:protein-disulfide reductase DsbD domain-containing protein [Gammaproteobacteria bacterium]
MKTRLQVITAGVAALAVIVIASGYWWMSSRPTQAQADNGPSSQASAYIQSQSQGTSGLANSADKVSVKAWFHGPAQEDDTRLLRVRLRIHPGWHVNANPATLRFLIPTTVKGSVRGKPVALRVSYPPGRDSNIRVNGKSIAVYDNGTILKARVTSRVLALARSAGALKILVTVQSCSDKGICLAPAQLSSTVALKS